MKKTMRQRDRTRGMSLIEVVIAMAVVVMISSGLLSGVFQTRKFTEHNVYETSAINAVTSYLEQIKSLPYGEVLTTVSNPATVPLETVFDDTTSDPIFVNQWNQKFIVINVDADGNVIEDMELWVYPEINNLHPTTGMKLIEVIIRYAWKPPGQRWYQFANMKYVRSAVETY